MEIKLFNELSKTQTYNILLGSYNLDYNILMSVNIHEPLETRAFYKGIISGIIRYGIDPCMYSNEFISDVLFDVQKASMASTWKNIPESIKRAIEYNKNNYDERKKNDEIFSHEVGVIELYELLVK